MARRVEGQIYCRDLKDDIVFMLRFRAAGYPTGPIELGRVSNGFNMREAQERRDLVRALIRNGKWEAPPEPEPPPARTDLATTWGRACARYLHAKRHAVKQRKQSTLDDLLIKLEVHLLPGIGPSTPIREIDPDVVHGYIQHVLEHNDRIRAAEERGEPLRRQKTEREIQRPGADERRAQRQRPIGNGQLIKHVELIGQILEFYVGKELDENPVGFCEHGLEYDPDQDWKLQSDEIVSLLSASASLDRPIVRPDSRRLRGACVKLRREGLTFKQIASKLGTCEGTVGYHLRRASQPAAEIIPTYRALIFVLMIAGLRISEALALRCGDIDLFNRTINVRKSKTGAGRRRVDIHEPLWSELIAYKRARGDTWTKDAYVFRTRNGTPLSRHNVSRRTMPRLVREAKQLRRQQGHPPISARVTAHAMRHAYVALLAHSSSPRIYVQRQAGHKRPTTADWAYNYVLEDEARDQVSAGLLGVLGRAQARLDGSRPRFPLPPEESVKSTRTAAQLALW